MARTGAHPASAVTAVVRRLDNSDIHRATLPASAGKGLVADRLPVLTVRCRVCRSMLISTVSPGREEVRTVSLKTFHLIFILIVIICAELFGMRELWYFQQTRDVLTLWLGILSLAGGLGLAVYALVFVRRMDSAGIT